jgi:hypothetical protein
MLQLGLGRRDGDMADTFDPVELAQEIAAIANSSQEAETARKLLKLVDRLLTQAGLPPLPARVGAGGRH